MKPLHNSSTPFSASLLSKLRTSTLLLALATLGLAACTTAPDFVQPEGASAPTQQQGWAGQRQAVAAANPLATQAGWRILKAGGSAVDAAIAVQMVLTLVEPQSSGIGGGAFLLHSNGATIEAFDGRETAPAAAHEQLFIGADGKPMPFDAAAIGGRSVGVPGAVRMLEMAHQQHGKLPWATLFAPAIALAEDGFDISPRLHTLLQADPHLPKDPAAAAYFYRTDGTPHPVGHRLRNPALAQMLRQIATQGSKALHEGDIAQAIVSKVQQHPTNPGALSLADLAQYKAIKRQALCHDYPTPTRHLRLCGFPPPSSGAIAVGQILGILAHTPASTMPLQSGLQGPTPSADWLHLYTEAARLAFADRAQYVADPDFVQPPAGHWASLLAPAYLAQRAKSIGTQSIKVAPPGNPGTAQISYAPMPDQPEYGTSHISIVDAHGNALAMTTTIEAAFGARQMVHGFLLNNQLTDFSFAPTDAKGQPIANRVQPGKRPRSSMAPTLVLDADTGQLLISAGSPGGAAIIHYTAKTLYGILHWGLTPQQAINLPNFGSMNGPTLLEEQRFTPATVQALRSRGAEVRETTMTSGLQALVQNTAPGTARWLGGADPRREGTVLGD